MNEIRYGMEGYDVQLLQYALERAGMDPGTPDGIFGRRTAKALLRFQREQGLSQDGVAGKLSWAALYPYIAGYTLHRIRPRDTFDLLAERYGTGVQAIRTANPAWDPEAPPVGESAVIPLDMPVVTHRIPYSSLLTGLVLQGLARRYPFLKVSDIGRSVMGQRIRAVSIGAGPRQVGYNAAHHANEWITVPLLLSFLEAYAAAWAAGGSVGGAAAKDLYGAATLHMVPLVNPDGVDLVVGALDPLDSFYAQAGALASHYPNIPFPQGWKSNISGVDLNLQYPAGWETARRIRFSRGYTRPGPREYVGSGPLMAPESRAVARWTEERDFALTVSWHTQGRVVCGQYGGEGAPGAGAIGEAMSRSSGYALRREPADSACGGYTDWFVRTWGRPGFTVKAGKGEDPLPLSRFEEIYQECLPILTGGLTLAP